MLPNIDRPGFKEAVEIWEAFAASAGWQFEKHDPLTLKLCSRRADTTVLFVAQARKRKESFDPDNRGALSWSTHSFAPYSTLSKFGFSCRSAPNKLIREIALKGYWRTVRTSEASFRTNDIRLCRAIASSPELVRLLQLSPRSRLSIESTIPPELLPTLVEPSAAGRLITWSIPYAVTDASLIYSADRAMHAILTTLFEHGIAAAK